MSLNVNHNYSPYSYGRAPISSYGNTNVSTRANYELIKYQLNTFDADGNKIMDKMSREETMNTINNIYLEIGDNVKVEFSQDGLAASMENKLGKLKPEISAEEKAIQEASNAAFSKVIIQKTARQFIPNIQTNEQLINSLNGLDGNVVDTAYDIINDNLLLRDAGDMTEEQRQGLISLGMEKAKYLADNYMEEDTASKFMDAMEQIAKYGMNGTVDESGKVSFDIRMGPKVGAPVDTVVDEYELMKNLDPDRYNEYMKLMNEGIKSNNNEFILKAGRGFIDWSKEIYTKHTGLITAAINDYKDWSQKIEATKVADTYSQSDRSDISSFIQSIQAQNGTNHLLDSSFLEDDMNKFINKLMLV